MRAAQVTTGTVIRTTRTTERRTRTVETRGKLDARRKQRIRAQWHRDGITFPSAVFQRTVTVACGCGFR
jgi:hypothetical protein